MTRTDRIRRAAIQALNGEEHMHETPREPTPAEALYLAAIELFEAGRICAGCDKLDAADALCKAVA
jgi:hypothetical protein